MSEELIFFESTAEFRNWLSEHHRDKVVLWVGYYKANTGKPSMRWEESVKEALCFGWIDGLRKSIDEESYKIRFTPRKSASHWSTKNIRMVEELIEEGRMQPAGLEAYRKRKDSNSANASYEGENVRLPAEYEERIKVNPQAWAHFQSLAPGIAKTSVHWVMSAKQEKTRLRRLEILIQSCENGQKIPPLRY